MERIPIGKFGFLDAAAIEWLQKHLFVIVGSVIAICALIAWMVSQGSSTDYRLADALFNRWNGTSGKELVQLTKLLKRHPELHAKYDGRIAQKLLLCSEKGLAASFSQSIFKRVESAFPYYAEFSRTSLLIGEKKFSAALSSAQELQKQIQSSPSYKMLSSYNLLRIAILQQTLHTSPQEELTAWQAFEENQDPETYAQICRNFQKNDVSLKEFIQHRKKFIEAQRP